MDRNSPEDRSGRDKSQWPTAPILAYGTFGMRNPAGRRYHFRSGIALAAMVVCMLSGVLLRPSLPKGSVDVITAFAPGAAFIYSRLMHRS